MTKKQGPHRSGRSPGAGDERTALRETREAEMTKHGRREERADDRQAEFSRIIRKSPEFRLHQK